MATAWIVLALAGFQAPASDWPQFLGPARDGVYPGSDLADRLPADGPPVLWQRKVGQGFSGPIVADEKLILFHRVGNSEVVEQLDAQTGKPVWKFEYPTNYRDDFGFDEGPRATPCVQEGRIYTFGADGMLLALDFSTGRKLWSVETRKEFKARKGFFGMACSPLVEGGNVVLNIGGPDDAAIVAFEKTSGKLAWKAVEDEASYSSPTAAALGGRRQLLVFSRSGLFALAPQDGRMLFNFPWRVRMNASVNAATPLVFGEEVFISEGYGPGAVLLRCGPGKPREVWSSVDALSNHYATSVRRGDFLYGYHGRQDTGRPAVRCVEWKTGKVRWSEEGFGAGTVTLAGDKLLLMHEDGRLSIAAAQPGEFKSLHESQILPNGVRPFPALANGLFFARSKDKLVCVDLRKRG